MEDINSSNDRIYPGLNNRVYRAGFARKQEAYEAGSRHLFPTLARFNVAYHGAFKCNICRLIDYPNLWAYSRDIYQMPGVVATVCFEIYKPGYCSPS